MIREELARLFDWYRDISIPEALALRVLMAVFIITMLFYLKINIFQHTQGVLIDFPIF